MMNLLCKRHGQDYVVGLEDLGRDPRTDALHSRFTLHDDVVNTYMDRTLLHLYPNRAAEARLRNDNEVLSAWGLDVIGAVPTHHRIGWLDNDLREDW